jgi:Fic family protein
MPEKESGKSARQSQYRELKTMYRSTNADYEAEYSKRVSAIGAVTTELHPYLTQYGEFKTKEYPLFSVPLPEIQLLSQRILENSRAIRDLMRSLPPIAREQFLNDQLAKAIIASNGIEGIHTTRREIAVAQKVLTRESEGKASKRASKTKQLSTVRSYLSILDLERPEQVETITIANLHDVRDIYDKLTEGEIAREDELDGELFRSRGVVVSDGQRARSNPPTNEAEISQMLLQWIDFIGDGSIPFLIRASLGHFFFENIHPFYDGNGRTGRYILTRYLAQKLDVLSGLVLSQKIIENRSKYYKAFEVTDDALNRAEGTFFVRTMSEFLEQGQEDVIDVLTDKARDLENVGAYLDSSEYSVDERNVLFALYQSQIFNDSVDLVGGMAGGSAGESIDNIDGITDAAILETASADGRSVRATWRAVDALERAGVIRLVTQRPKRHRIVEEKV